MSLVTSVVPLKARTGAGILVYPSVLKEFSDNELTVGVSELIAIDSAHNGLQSVSIRFLAPSKVLDQPCCDLNRLV